MDRSKWEYKKLGEVATFINGDRGVNYPSQTDFVEVGIPFVNAGHLTNNKVDFSSMNYIKREKYDKLGSGKIQKGDILFCLRGSLGKKAIADNLEEGAIASSLVIIRPSKLNTYFLSYYLESPSIKREILRSNNGSSQPNLSAKSVSRFAIPIPPISDQQRIVAELDCLNEMIAVKQEQLKEFDKLAQSIFYDMFGDLSLNNKGWPKKPFTEIAVAKTGITYKPDNVKDSGIIVLRSSNVQDDELAFEDVVRVDLPISEKYHVQNGDILMCSRNGSARLVGKTARIRNVNEIMTWGAFMTIIRSQYNDYLLHYFKTDTFRDSLSSSKTTTVHQITIGMLNALNIPLPPLSLQQQFAEKISAIEAQKELVKQSIAETQALLDYTMDKYFG